MRRWTVVEGVLMTALGEPWPDREPPPWGPRLEGQVLEVGLGAGRLSRAIAANPRVWSHVIVERDLELVEALREATTPPVGELGPWIPPSAWIVPGTFPDVELNRADLFDAVTLDVGGITPELLAAAARRLNRAGSIWIWEAR